MNTFFLTNQAIFWSKILLIGIAVLVTFYFSLLAHQMTMIYQELQLEITTAKRVYLFILVPLLLSVAIGITLLISLFA